MFGCEIELNDFFFTWKSLIDIYCHKAIIKSTQSSNDRKTPKEFGVAAVREWNRARVVSNND